MKILSFVASLAIALVGVPISFSAAQADNYPSKPITIVVGFAPGGPTDTVARVIGQHMSKTLGESVIVENQTGAAGTIAMNRVFRSPPDGYTLSVGQWTTNVGAVIANPVQFDVLKDFTPISLLASSPNILLVKADSAFKTVADVIAQSRAKPGSLAYAHAGTGTSTHLAGELLKNLAKIDINAIPYKGGAPAINDLLGGQIPM